MFDPRNTILGRPAQVTLSLNVERLNLELPYLRTGADVDSGIGE